MIDIEPEVLGRSQSIALGLVGDARCFLESLHQLLGERRCEPEPAWLDALLRVQAGYRAELEALADARLCPQSGRINEAALAREIARVLPPDAIVVFDGGQIMEWTQSFVRPRDPQSFGFAPGMGHLGFGLPFANAAKLLYPERPVVLVTGDGAMGMTAQELETAVRYGLGITVVVANDSAWGMYRPLGEQLRNPNFGTRLGDVDFARVAEGFGAHGARVENFEQLAPALSAALRADRPALVDVRCAFTPHPIDAFWPEVVLRGLNFAPQ